MYLNINRLFFLSQDEVNNIDQSGKSVRQLLVWTFDSVQRLQKFHQTYPTVLHDLARDAVTELTKPNYGKSCLDNLKRDIGWKK